MIKNSRGMTLIELLLVLALVVSLAGMATVGFVNFMSGQDPKLFVKDMSSYVRYLQFKAIEEGKILKLNIERREGTVQVYAQDTQKKFVPIHDSLSKRFESEDRYKAEIENGQEIFFFPDGTVTRAQIRVFDRDRKIASLAVKNRLGGLKVEFNA